MRIADYLAASGATEIKEVRPFLLQFRLPGDNHPAGRAATTRDGQVRIWHRGARDGLELSDKWRPAVPVDLEPGRSVPSYIASLSDLEPDEKIVRIEARSQRVVASDEMVRVAALSLLESYGWRQHGSGQGIAYLNDGDGATPACRMAVKNGIASVWNFRGDLDLPEPWRPGRTLATGEKTMYATGHDLGIAATHTITTPVSPPPPSRPPVDNALAAQVMDWWQRGEKAPEDHRHLTKSDARLLGEGLRLMPADSGHSGDLLVPTFRPAADAKVALEVSGGQRLCASAYVGTDKMLLSGSRLADSFVPIPISPLMSGNSGDLVNFEGWIKSLGDLDKPLVVCEGVATALAIHESGAGHPVAAISSGNLKGVAKWLSESGYAARFPDFVIAADYDVGLKNGKPASMAISKAIDAATEVGAKVALPPAGSRVGTDARDLYAKGPEAVRDYVASALPPGEARARPDIEKFMGCEKELER